MSTVKIESVVTMTMDRDIAYRVRELLLGAIKSDNSIIPKHAIALMDILAEDITHELDREDY